MSIEHRVGMKRKASFYKDSDTSVYPVSVFPMSFLLGPTNIRSLTQLPLHTLSPAPSPIGGISADHQRLRDELSGHVICHLCIPLTPGLRRRCLRHCSLPRPIPGRWHEVSAFFKNSRNYQMLRVASTQSLRTMLKQSKNKRSGSRKCTSHTEATIDCSYFCSGSVQWEITV